MRFRIAAVISLLSFMFISIHSVHASETWWIYHVAQKKCMPASSAGGLDMRPSNVVSGFPQCAVSVYNQDTGIMMMDCTKSRLRTSFVYGSSLLSCMSAKRVVDHLR